LGNKFTGLVHVFPGNRSDDYTNLYATFPPHIWVEITINSSTTTGPAHA